ncbi:MAG: CBS domain-containing protein, partial [Candidatus Omnitrophica bacterium]|nr:CBS domain-containing protein [Candidatus Omnitrophota bacterium]
MKIPLLVPEIREYLAQNNTEELKEFCETNSPAMVADFLSALEPDEVWAVLQSVSPQLRAEIFAYLEPDVQKELVEKLPREQLARLFSDMSPDDRADLFKSLPEDKQEMILPAMAQAEREDIRRLSSYPEGTAGAVMTSDYASLPADITAAEAINRLRREAPDRETIYYAYVVDEKRRLLGFVSLKDLILAHPEEKIEKFIKNLKEVIVAEEIDPIIESQIKKIAKETNPTLKVHGKDVLPKAGEIRPEYVLRAIFRILKKDFPQELVEQEKEFTKIKSQKRLPRFCSGCPHLATLWAIKKAIGKEAVIGGDIGCYLMAALP